MNYTQNNEVARGYLLKALNHMIENEIITETQGEKVLYNFAFECDSMTEKQALEYSRTQRLGDTE